MDSVEVLVLLRPTGHEYPALDDLLDGFTIVSEMVRRKTRRMPSAPGSFLGAHTNAPVDENGQDQPSKLCYEPSNRGGYTGDVYPATLMWESAPTSVYARYPFPASIETMRHGGF